MHPTSPTATLSAEGDDTNVAPILGDEARMIISCNQKLQELGIDETIKLPRIVVIGDQSTGKSSLIEAISSVKVPKAADLCTKCPIAINLSSGRTPTSPWSCVVSIEEKFSYNPDVKSKKNVSKANPFGPWQARNEPKISEIRVLDDPEELIHAISIAERQVLNPLGNGNTETFSPNAIRLDVSRGSWPNLSFVDLPGVIQNAGKSGQAYFVKLVAGLAKFYASQENNIIMLTLPVNHDVANSGSYSIIQEQKAEKRTLAAFTKPDMAQDEELDGILKKHFVDEVEEEFEYGTHMLMLAPQKSEEEFFSKPPWVGLEASMKARLGVKNLTDRLREVLFKKTSEALPGNLDKIKIRLAQVEQQLHDLPPPPDALELPYRLREQINKFESRAKQLFTSTSSTGSTSRSRLLSVMKEFNKQIQDNKPTMLLKTEAEANQLAQAEQATKAQLSQDPVSLDSDSSTAPQVVSTVTKASPKKATKNGIRKHQFRLEDVRQLNQDQSQNAIPGDIEPRAMDKMYVLSVQYWDKIFRDFMVQISKLLHQEVLECVSTTFEPERHLPVHGRLTGLTKEFLDLIIHEEWALFDAICAAEQNVPFTFNAEAMKQTEAQSLTLRREKRADARITLQRAIQKANTDNAGKKKKKSSEAILDDLGPDPWDVEVQMATRARAYYEVASTRFVDNICQLVFARLVPRAQEGLVHYFRSQLGLDDIPANREQIALLLSEDAEREADRVRLISEMERLNEGHAYIAQALGPAASAGSLFADVVATGSMTCVNSAFSSPRKRKSGFDASDSIDGSPSKRNLGSTATNTHRGIVHRSRSQSMDMAERE